MSPGQSCREGVLSRSPAMERQLVTALLACLVFPAAAAATDLYEEPELADVLADPAADGYDRTFSMCQVEAKEFQATVRSTAYRVLKGVCNPGELEKYLDSMEKRLNKKLDDFIVTITGLLRHSSGADSRCGSSASTGRHGSNGCAGDATKHATLKAEKKKQYASTHGHGSGSGQKHLKHAMPQNDNWSRTSTSASDERRLAVQNLLPGGRRGSTASTLFKPQSNALYSQRDWQGHSVNYTSPAIARPRSTFQNSAVSGHSQNSRQQFTGQTQSPKNDQPPGSRTQNTAKGQPDAAPQRHTGRGQHVTDTISYVSPRQSAPASRYAEVPAYNDTVYFMNGGKMYSYYWKIENFSAKMATWRSGRSIRSPCFYVFHGGYRLFLRLFPRRNGNSVLIRVALTSGRYDSSVPWPFRLPFRLSVLDHSVGPDDLQSRVWRPAREPCPRRTWQRPAQRRRQGRHGRGSGHDSHACLGLSVPHPLLARRRALLGDALLVKLDVFLDGDIGRSGKGRRVP